MAGLPADLRKRIEIMAEHIARNGQEFEATVKQKNLSNPQFAFLHGGEGSDYYQQLLRQSGEPHVSPASLPELLQKWREPPVASFAAESQLAGFLSSLEQVASRDSIRAGRLWIEQHVDSASAIAGHIMKRIVWLSTSSHRLHVLYLVHDLLQTEAVRKDPGRPLASAFKPYLVWLLRPTYQLADEGGKVLRLLQLWVERGILSNQEAEEMRMITVATDLMQAQSPLGPMAKSPSCTDPMQTSSQPRFERPTPETLPVGVMATSLISFRKSRKNSRAGFIPYLPLDEASIPQSLPSIEAPTPRLMERVDDFYQDLRDDERSSSSSSRSSSSSSQSRSRSRGRKTTLPSASFLSAVPPPAF